MDGDGFYILGEGLGGVVVEVADGEAKIASTSTWASGGYSLPVPTGTFDVAIHGPGGTMLIPSVRFIVGRNEKVDLDVSDAEANLALFAANFGRVDCAPIGPCPGDSDGDGDVDGRDLAAFGSTSVAGQQVHPAGEQ